MSEVLSRKAICLGLTATDKTDVITQCGSLLVTVDTVTQPYANAMFGHEHQVPAYLGEGAAIPHGTGESREHIQRTCLDFLQFPGEVDWDDGRVFVCTPIASRGEEHVEILGELAKVLMGPDAAAQLRTITGPGNVLRLLGTFGEKNRILALRFYTPEGLHLEDVLGPTYETDEVKVRMKSCSTCGTNMKIRKNRHQNLTPPHIVGHEIAGEVVEVSSGVASDWKPGNRVQVIAAVPCGKCHECQKGWMTVYQNRTSAGYQYDGGFAEYMIVPRGVLAVDDMNRIPDGVGFTEASAAESFTRAINAQEQLGIGSGDSVVISGAGSIDCLHIHITRGVHKAGRIILVDISSEWLKMSADTVKPDIMINTSEANIVKEILKLTGGRGTDVIITATPANITRKQAVSMAACSGRISFFDGLPKTNSAITLDSNLVYYRQLRIYSASGPAPEHNRRVLDYIASGGVPVANLIIRRVRLRDVMDAFRIVKRSKAIKITVEP